MGVKDLTADELVWLCTAMGAYLGELHRRDAPNASDELRRAMDIFRKLTPDESNKEATLAHVFGHALPRALQGKLPNFCERCEGRGVLVASPTASPVLSPDCPDCAGTGLKR